MAKQSEKPDQRKRRAPAAGKPKPPPTSSASSQVKGFRIVGIGASAGGLEALEQFFANMPSDSGMAFVIVQHLDPVRHSSMPEILTRFTKMPIQVATNGTVVKPNAIYLIPPNKNMGIENGKLFLQEANQPPQLKLPVDFFFRTLAKEKGSDAICIIVSGTGTDGTLGLRAVKAELGTVFVQSPSSAKYDGMPLSALETGLADFVLPPEEMPKKLIAFVKHMDMNSADSTIEEAQKPLQQIFSILLNRTGHDFSRYKKTTIRRRLQRRMSVNQLTDLAGYAAFIRDNAEEIKALLKDLLISVTSFFRDPQAFEALESELKTIIKNKDNGSDLRIWIAGCATGEEAYSVGIIVTECLEELEKHLTVQMYGTDIDVEALQVARTGKYPANIAADITPERLRRFFIREGNSYYRIKKEIREMLVFAPHNFIKDPPFSRMDLICCRNLLIYLESDVQKPLMPLLHYALRPGGILMLGPSESVADSTDLFEAVDKKWKIFQRREAFVATERLRFPSSFSPAHPVGGKAQPEISPNSIPVLTEKVFLDEFAPTFAVIDEKYRLIYVRGKTGKYLEIASGQPSLSILDMAKAEIRSELASAIYEASSHRRKVVREGLAIKHNGSSQLINLTVGPLHELGLPPGYLMIVFQEVGRIKTDTGLKPAAKSRKALTEVEEELKLTKESLQATIEELEATNEELKSANEELQSNNEELQSTNEELDTSQEELQSLNEELTTLNAELQDKNEQMIKINDDMRNFLNRTEIGILILDAKLNIRSYTPATSEIFNIRDIDVGRPLADITSRLNYDALVDDAANVLRTLQSTEQEVQRKDGSWFTMRILPYITAQNSVNGVVMSFLSIDLQKKAECTLSDINTELQSAMNKVRVSEENLRITLDFTYDWEYWIAPDGKILYMSPSCKRISGYKREEFIKNPALLKDILHPDDKEKVAHHNEAIDQGPPFTVRFRILTKKGEICWMEHVCQAVFDDDGKWLGRRTSNRDITEQMKAEIELRETRDYLENLFNYANAPIIVWDPDYLITRFNGAFEHLTGRKAKEVIGKKLDILFPAESKENALKYVNGTFKGDRWEVVEIPILHKDGSVRTVLWNSATLYDGDGKTVIATIAQGQDITERKRKDEEILRINRELRAISDCNQVMVRAKNEHELCTAVSTIMCDVAGYRMAWVGIAEHDKAKTVRPCGWGGMEDNYLSEIKVTWADNELGRGPTGLTIRSGKTHFMNDFDSVPSGAPWRKAAMARGYRSSIALPLKNSVGESIGAFMLYADRPNAFFPEEVRLLEELAADLGFGIMALRDREERKLAEAALIESEHDLRRAQAVGRIGSWRLDLQHNVLLWSDETYFIFGIPPGTPMTYETFIAAVHPDDRAFVDERWNAALKGEPYNCEHRIVVDREIKWVREIAELDLDEKGELQAGFGTVQDISERKMLEEEIRSIARFPDENPNPILRVKADGTVIYGNAASGKLLGNWKTKVGKTLPAGIIKPLQEALSKSTPVEMEVSFDHHVSLLLFVPVAQEGYVNIYARDITERKQAEEKLRETTDFLENLFNYANAPIIVWDPDYRITRFNGAFEHLTGRKAADVIGKKLDILFPTESKENALKHVNGTYKGDRWEVVEIPILHADGSVRTVLWNSATLYDGDGKTVIATIAQGQDITERKQAEEQLRETTDFLENLFNYANAPIIVWDPDYRITRFNGAFEHLTGRKAAEVIGEKLDILFPAESKENALKHVNGTYKGDRWEVVEIPILHTDGSVRTVLWNSATLYDTDGKTVVATIAQGQDITERKQSEMEIQKLLTSIQEEKEKLSTLINSIPDEVWFADSNGNFTLANPSALHEFGLASAGVDVEALARSLEVLRPDGSPRPVEESPPLKALNGEFVRNQEEIIRTPASGELRYRQVSAAPVTNPAGDIIGSVSVVRDVTETKRSEFEMRRLNRELRAISDCNQVMVRATDERSLCADVSRIICDVAGYRMAWVGYVEHDKAKTIRPVAWCGTEDGYLTESKYTWADSKQGQRPASLAIRSGKTQFLQDIATESPALPWHKQALARGYRSCIAIPLRDLDDKIMGCFTLYTGEPSGFNPDEVRLMEELAGDLAFGIANLRLREERNRAEASLHESEERFRAIADNVDMMVTVSRPSDTKILYSNPAANKALGYDAGGIIGLSTLDVLFDPDDRLKILDILKKQGEVKGYETEMKRKDGSSIWYSLSVSSIRYAGEDAVITAGLDITERRVAEIEMRRLNRELRAISDCNQIMVRATDEIYLCQEVSRIICDVAGYRMAWVGYVEHDRAKTIRPVAWCGTEDGYLTEHHITWADSKQGQRPSSIAIRSGKTQFSQDIANDTAMMPWRKEALARGYGSSIAIPLFDQNNNVFGAFTLYTGEPSGFNPDEVRLMEELAGDLAFGIANLRLREERNRAEASLHESEERFRAIAENSMIQISVSTLDGTYLYANPTYEKAFGFPVGTLVGKKSLNFYVDPEDRNRIINTLKTKGIVSDFEVQVKKQDGKPFWVSGAISFITLGGEKVILGTSIDITERKEADERLRKSEHRFRSLFTSMSEGVCEHEVIYDDAGKAVDYRILECNPVYEQITALPRDKAINQKASELYGTGTPPYMDIYTNVAESGEPAYFETYFPPMKKHFSISVFSPGKGKFVTVFADITERKRQQEAINGLAKFPEENPNAVLRVMHDGTLTYHNSGSAPLVHHWKIKIGEKLPTRAMNLLQEALQNNKVVEDELAIGDQYLSCLYVPIKNVDYLNVYCRDITGRRQAELELEAAKDLLATDLNAMTLLADLSTRFIRQGDLNAVLADIVNTAIAITSAKKGTIQLLDTTTSKLTMAAQKGFKSPFLKAHESITEGVCACGTALKEKKRIIVADISKSPHLSDTLEYQILLDAGVHAVQSTPLVSRSGKVLGTFSTHYLEPHQPDENELRFLDLLARQAADIIERAQAEDALHKAHAMLEAVTSGTEVIIAAVDQDYRYIFFNQAYREELQKITGKELHLGMSVQELYADMPEQLKISLKEWGQVLNGETTNLIARFGNPKKYNRTYSIHYTPLFTASGAVFGAGEASIDITPMEEARQALQQAHDELEVRVEERTGELILANQALVKEQQRFQEVLDMLPVYIILLDKDYHVPFDNKFFRERFGESFGKRCFDYLFHRTEPCEVCETYKVYDVNKPLEWEWTGPDGHNYYIYDFPFVDTDGSDLIMEVGVDITERKKAEAALKQAHDELEIRVEERTRELRDTRDFLENLINYANAPIVVWDTDSKITVFNHAFERLIGKTAEEMIGQKLEVLFPEESRGHAMTHVNGAIKGRRLEVEEIPILCTDGKVCTVLWNSATLYDADGKAIATIAQGQDITERKVAEESLVQRTVDLEQANRELEAFSFSVSHDLRAPLRSIDGFSQLILRRYFDKLDDKGKDYLDELRRSSQLMAQLMDDILTLSRISRYELSRDRVDVSALAISVAKDLKKNQPEHNVEFVIAQDLQATGDERLIKIVLENLLGNSYKFTGKTKKAKIEVGTTEIEGARTFFVRDNGAGFDMHFIDKLFKPFHRLHTPAEFPGTGIGLASVQRIIERHGGRVWAEAALDKGATFFFTLPGAGTTPIK